jgi:regulatory protein
MRPRSEKEIKERLLKKSFSKDTIGDVVLFLKDKNYINDKEFAKSWVRNRIACKPVGKFLLRYQLRQKGIDEQILEDAVNDAAGDFDEEEQALQLASIKKEKFSNIETQKAKKRIADFLKRRGFSTSTIFDTIRELYDKEQ